MGLEQVCFIKHLILAFKTPCVLRLPDTSIFSILSDKITLVNKKTNK